MNVARISWLGWPVVIVGVQLIFFPAPAGSFVAGAVLGLITALVAFGMYLVYRANRVINFAAAEIGLLPGVVAMLLIVENGLTWWLAFPLGFVAAAVLGVAAEFIVIRRFFEAPRLVVTVATIGVAQLLGVVAIFIPAWWDTKLQSQRIPAPFDHRFDIGSRTLNTNHIIAVIVAPLAIAGVAAILRWTRVGIAIRAAAELPARAGLLGIPVKGLQSIVWGLATVLGFLAIFLRAGIYGIPVGGQLGLLFLLRALAALTIGRMAHLPTILGSAVALGILQEGIIWNSGAIEAEAQMGAITGGVIVAALLVRRDRGVRSALDTASWQNVGDSRPLAAVFHRLPEVRVGRLLGGAALAVAMLWAIPYSGWFGTTVINRFGEIYTFSLILLSLGVLTGWAGQLSLGQLAFSAIGGVTAAKLTGEWNWDITVATLAAGAVGAAASLVVGLPALRLRGAYLAVTTLAFGIVVSQFFLNPQFFDWVLRDNDRIERKPILGVVDWNSSRAAYFVALATMVIGFVAVHGIRNSRTGRVLIALRDNETATEAYGVSAVRAKLTAFAISGFLASCAGAIFTHHQQFFTSGDPQLNFGAFAASVIGGLGTVGGAFLGSLYFNGTFFWLSGAWRLFSSAIGILVVLLFAPAGLLGFWQDLRDLVVRRLGRRRGIVEADESEDRFGAADDAAHDPAVVSA